MNTIFFRKNIFFIDINNFCKDNDPLLALHSFDGNNFSSFPHSKDLGLVGQILQMVGSSTTGCH